MVNKTIEAFEKAQKKANIVDFKVGDTLSVVTRIVEGEKERLQAFQGTVIARKGSGLSETVTLHRVSNGVGVERVFNLHSPRIAEIVLIKHGKVRKAKLYYICGEKGKGAKIQERIMTSGKKVEVSSNVQEAVSSEKVS